MTIFIFELQAILNFDNRLRLMRGKHRKSWGKPDPGGLVLLMSQTIEKFQSPDRCVAREPYIRSDPDQSDSLHHSPQDKYYLFIMDEDLPMTSSISWDTVEYVERLIQQYNGHLEHQLNREMKVLIDKYEDFRRKVRKKLVSETPNRFPPHEKGSIVAQIENHFLCNVSNLYLDQVRGFIFSSMDYGPSKQSMFVIPPELDQSNDTPIVVSNQTPRPVLHFSSLTITTAIRRAFSRTGSKDHRLSLGSSQSFFLGAEPPPFRLKSET